MIHTFVLDESNKKRSTDYDESHLKSALRGSAISEEIQLNIFN